ncbi:MAG: coenzyme F420-0:L-glutamate ligase [Dermatophilaceae bacterium]
MRSAPLTVIPVTGLPEVQAGADLGGLLAAALTDSGIALTPGDCLVVSSKVVSKALGRTWPGPRADAVDAASVRVVAERRGRAGVTRVVESVAGPVMAAAGVDASNTGPGGEVLLLPEDPDREAHRLRAAVLEALGLGTDLAVAVLLSDTAGRPWRDGLTDLAIGAAGLHVLDDLRGAHDADGRPLAVTTRAVADEVAGAADLVKGKADGIPAALVRGLPVSWFSPDGIGARAVVRTGAGDWFALGHVEAVRAALGAAPGSDAAAHVGVPATDPEPIAARVTRVVALALLHDEDGGADVALGTGADVALGTGADVALGTGADVAAVTLTSSDAYGLGRLVARLEVAAHAERLRATSAVPGAGSVTVHLAER